MAYWLKVMRSNCTMRSPRGSVANLAAADTNCGRGAFVSRASICILSSSEMILVLFATK